MLELTFGKNFYWKLKLMKKYSLVYIYIYIYIYRLKSTWLTFLLSETREMAAILQIFFYFFVHSCIQIQILLKFVSKDPSNKKPLLG